MPLLQIDSKEVKLFGSEFDLAASLMKIGEDFAEFKEPPVRWVKAIFLQLMEFRSRLTMMLKSNPDAYKMEFLKCVSKSVKTIKQSAD